MNFFSCSDGKDCSVILFRAAWVADSVDLAGVNAWNATKLFGRAHLDSDDDPNLEMAVNLDRGVNTANLDDTFSYWRQMLELCQEEVLEN